MAYLRMYLTPLKSRYGHSGLLAKANTTMITSLPVVRPGDPQFLNRFVGRLNDVIANLNLTGMT